MINKFKFFKGYIGTLDLMDDQTYATASLYNPHTLSVEVNANPLSNNEMERYYGEHFRSPTYGSHMEMIRQNRRFEQMRNHGRISHEQYMMNRDMLIEQERIRRLGMINHSRETDERIRLFQATTTVTVNPTLWTKVKIFGTRVKMVLIETWKFEPIGVVVVSMLITLLTIIGIAKLFGA
jgi:hypothetical protein